MFRLIIPLLIVALALSTSCVSYKNMKMLEAQTQIAATDSAVLYQLSPLYDYKFRHNDQLFIKVNAYEGNTKDN